MVIAMNEFDSTSLIIIMGTESATSRAGVRMVRSSVNSQGTGGPAGASAMGDWVEALNNTPVSVRYTCFIQNGIRSPITTASRNSTLAEGTAEETTPRSGPTRDPISIDWDAVRPMRANPRTSDHVVGSPIRLAQEEFNHSYCALLQRLEEAFNDARKCSGPQSER
jgi:hypothetical protein